MRQQRAATPRNAEKEKIPELDGARAISIVFVLLVHLTYGRISGGFLGVDVFFVLSGYLITMLLLREHDSFGRIHLHNFYMRRVLRILPALVLASVLAVALSWSHSSTDEVVWRIAAVLLFWANFPDSKLMGNLVHTWSLSVEEQFYIVWPALLIASLKAGRKTAAFVAVAAICAAVLVRFWMVRNLDDFSAVYTFTLARMDSIMVGCLMAILEPHLLTLLGRAGIRVVSAIAWASLAALIGFLLFAQKHVVESEPLSFLVFALVAGVFILASQMTCSTSPLRTTLRLPIVQWLGQRSYGLYLYHYPIFLALEPQRVQGDLLNFAFIAATKVVLSLAFTEIAWRYLEQPILRLRRHYLPSR